MTTATAKHRYYLFGRADAEEDFETSEFDLDDLAKVVLEGADLRETLRAAVTAHLAMSNFDGSMKDWAVDDYADELAEDIGCDPDDVMLHRSAVRDFFDQWRRGYLDEAMLELEDEVVEQMGEMLEEDDEDEGGDEEGPSDGDDVAKALRAAGLPVVPCGLNADWSVRAWHLGPSGTPNVNDGDYYLLDDESDDDTYSVATYDPSAMDREDGGDTSGITMIEEEIPLTRLALPLARVATAVKAKAKLKPNPTSADGGVFYLTDLNARPLGPEFPTRQAAKLAAKRLVRERAHPAVEVWHRWRGDQYMQGMATEDGWSDV